MSRELMWAIIFSLWIAVATSGDANVPAASVVNEDNPVWHLLSRETQHGLASVIRKYGDSAIEDANVSTVLSNLLHDELVTEKENQDRELAKEEAEDREFAKQLEAEEKAAAEERQARKAAVEAAAEARRKAHHEQLEAEHKAHEAARQAEAAKAKARDEARQREHDQFMKETQERHERAQERAAAHRKEQEDRWAHTAMLLKQVHAGLEEVTHGWSDAPFWDDFFRNTSTADSWSKLRLDHLRPALNEVELKQEHRVLVLEPSGAGLAKRLADALRTEKVQSAEARTYGAEVSDSHDLVVEVGLLDAMALGNGDGTGADASKLSALRKAAGQLSSLVKPGGTWMSISVVPPALRVPLLGRLAGKTFAIPSESEDPKLGTHNLVLKAETTTGGTVARSPGLRGASQVADLLMYGTEDAHVWAYRLRRADAEKEGSATDGAPAEADGILDMIRQQRPWTRDDL